MVKPQEIKIQIVCRNLPGSRFEERTGVRLGIQKGTTVVEDVGAEASSATFVADVRVSQDPANGTFQFFGPFAQGPPQERFLYLCWGERKNGIWEGFRRAKLPLRYSSPDIVEAALTSKQPITVVLNMTDDIGGPLCASIKSDKIAWQL